MYEYVTNILFRGDVVLLVLVFFSVLLGTFVVLSIISGAIDLRRRASAAAVSGRGEQGRVASAEGALSTSKKARALSKLLPTDEASKSELRKFLWLAGFESGAAPAIYQLVRLVLALVLGFAAVVYSGSVFANPSIVTTLPASMGMALLGYYLPKTLVSLRRDAVIARHRNGFPDFLDLMVICADAGVGVESAIDRVSRELAVAHPSLARNLQIMSMEMRAGRSRHDALSNLADRLGIEEARSFATLLQQSEELGTSLVQALRVYSDEMRAKRFARAEEKAMGLPAKLVIPLGLCVFPVILAVVLLPVIIKIYKALGIY
jgi:tight adherence protein C